MAYAGLEMNGHALNSLPENGVPAALMIVEIEHEIVSDDSVMPDLGPPKWVVSYFLVNRKNEK